MQQTFAAEQLSKEDRLETDPDDGSVSLELATRHYYGADDKLMAVQRYSWRGPSFSDGTWEEYWYDALGRRVLTRARRDPISIYDALISGPLCKGGIQCRSFTERVWWDGDQPLVEQRTAEGTSDVSNSGTIGNIHGLSLDEPLAVMADQTRIVNYNWRGQGESSVFADGSPADASLGNVSTEIDWPALTQAQTYFTPGPGSSGSGNPKRWMGTFVANGQGTTGMLYRRNRYFNPNGGQFTQADPIGIAGGMNAFGFAGGDPVNFSDPFGLCIWDLCVGEATAVYVLTGAALTATGYIAAHPDQVQSAANVLSVGIANVSLKWNGASKKILRAITVGGALIGSVIIGKGQEGASAIARIQAARVEAEQKKKKQEEEIRRKGKNEDSGGGSGRGPDGKEGEPSQ